MSILSMVYDFIVDTVVLIPSGHPLESYSGMVESITIILTFAIMGIVLGAIIKLILWAFNIISSRFYL